MSSAEFLSLFAATLLGAFGLHASDLSASFDAASGIVRLRQEFLADKTMAYRAPIEKSATAKGGFKP